jgi:hypothetical protein
MPHVLDALAMASNFVVPPERLEFGAEPAEFIDERLLTVPDDASASFVIM